MGVRRLPPSQGLVHLHNLRRLHRDVKGGNILINDDGDVKIGALVLLAR